MRTLFRVIVVMVVASGLTALSIDATDTLTGSQSTLLAQLWSTPLCEAGMREVLVGEGRICMDAYEASAAVGCDVGVPSSLQGTVNNLANPDCEPRSVAGAEPWTFVTFAQARQLCSRAGKRLPTPREWYEAALGTPDTARTCQINGDRVRTGVSLACQSGAGMFDMVGNVWEYVSNDSLAIVAESGYVADIDTAGLPIRVHTEPQLAFNNDYIWAKEMAEEPIVVRGGFYGGGEDAGLFAVQATLTGEFSSAAIGFRCVKDL